MESDATSSNLYSLFTNVEGTPNPGGTAWIEYTGAGAALHFEGGTSTAIISDAEKYASIIKVDNNASAETKQIATTVAKAYTNIVAETKAYLDSGSNWADTQNGDRAHRVYTVDKDGNLVAEGGKDAVAWKNTWDNAYHQETAGNAVIAGQTISWQKGDVIQIAIRKGTYTKGSDDTSGMTTPEITVAKKQGDLWRN